MGMKDKSVLIGSGVFGLLAGFAVMTGSLTIKNITVAGMLALPTAFVTHLASDSAAQKRINQADDRVKGLQKKLDNALSKTDALEELEKNCWNLAKELNMVRSALDLAVGEHQKASDLNLYLQQTLTTLQADLEVSQGRIEELQAECEAWEEEFSDRVAVEAEAKFQQAKKAEIERIFQEHDAITSQAMALFRQLQGWGEKVAHGHAAKREIIKNLAASYNANLEELGESVEKERGHYLQQIELLHEKIGRLQHELAGDLVEPVYGQFGFDQNGRIANAIAEWLWNHHKIPLKVTGFEVSGDVLTVGYIYPRSMPLEALSRQIEGDSIPDSP
jgi:chromosome segregation ATPase